MFVRKDFSIKKNAPDKFKSVPILKIYLLQIHKQFRINRGIIFMNFVVKMRSG